MRLTTEEIGKWIKTTRKSKGLTQRALATTSGTGLRFIIELEKGKPTCQFGKALTVINTLGISLTYTPPVADPSNNNNHPAFADSASQTKAERFVGMGPVEPQWD